MAGIRIEKIKDVLDESQVHYIGFEMSGLQIKINKTRYIGQTAADIGPGVVKMFENIEEE